VSVIGKKDVVEFLLKNNANPNIKYQNPTWKTYHSPLQIGN
jgi:hypothetical protein